MVRLNFYTRPGCGLCDRLKAMLAQDLRAMGIELHDVNIADDPGLTEQFGFRIPVVTLDDRIILEGRPDEAQVRNAMQALKRELEGRPRPSR